MKKFLAVFAMVILAVSVQAAAAETGQLSVCPCSTVTPEMVSVILENTEEIPQDYDVELMLPDSETWSGFAVPEISLGPHEEKAVPVFITPSCSVVPGVYEVGIKATSVSGEKQELLFEIVIEKCHWVDFEPGEYEICQEALSTTEITIENNGGNKESLVISSDADWISFPEQKFTVESGESMSVEALFDPGEDVIGDVEAAVKLESETSYFSTEKMLKAKVSRCFANNVYVDPESQDVCPCMEANFTLFVENIGMLEDNYVVSYNEQTGEMVIKPNETGEVELSFEVPCDKEPGEYPLTVSVESVYPKEATMNVNVVPHDECYGVTLLAQENVSMDVEVGKAFSYMFTVYNDGIFMKDYELVMDAPSWIHVSEKSVKLEPDASKDIYLYIAPDYSVEAGNYSVSIAFVGENEQDRKEFVVYVNSDYVTPSDGQGQGESPDGEPSADGGDGVSMNISVPTGDVVGIETGDRPWTQIILITILAVGVVIILILRFVVLIK